MAAASPKRTLSTVLAAAVTVLLGATPVGAQQANPQPTSCAGMAFTDARGDAISTRDNVDISGGFLRYGTNSAGENVLTANIQVTNLDEQLEIGAYFHAWMFRWTNGVTVQYARAAMLPGRMAFSYDPDPSDDEPARATTGRMFQGPNGIIEIVLPVAELGLEGKRLKDPHAVSQVAYSDGFLNYMTLDVDSAPDSRAGGKPFDVVPCAQETTPTTPQPTAGAGQAAGAPRLKLEVVIGKLSARKISKRRSLAIGLRAGERTTALRARLKRGTKLVATGGLASVSGKGTARLRLSAKKLKPGTYTLHLTGRTADGRVASRDVKVRVRR